MKKNIIIVLFSFLIGSIITSFLFYSFIENQRNAGYNNGYITGKFEVLNFLKENIQNTKFSKEEIKVLNQQLSVKYASISVVEINGIKTIIINE